MRLYASVTILTGQDVAAIWAGIPEKSRRSYGGTPMPGQPVAQGLDYTKAPDPACFAVLRLELLTIDALHLGPRHRRARFDRVDNWAGEWLAPRALQRLAPRTSLRSDGSGRSAAQRRHRFGIDDQTHAKRAGA